VVTDEGACKDYPISGDDTLWLPANTRLAIKLSFFIKWSSCG